MASVTSLPATESDSSPIWWAINLCALFSPLRQQINSWPWESTSVKMSGSREHVACWPGFYMVKQYILIQADSHYSKLISFF